jgi:hypothetical protein
MQGAKDLRGARTSKKNETPQVSQGLATRAASVGLIKIKNVYSQMGYANGMELVPPLCPCCRNPMKLVRTIEHLGSLPELSVFYCAECQQAETRWQGQEQRKAA